LDKRLMLTISPGTLLRANWAVGLRQARSGRCPSSINWPPPRVSTAMARWPSVLALLCGWMP